MMRGRFITVEGIEGVGKSTNIAFIAEQVRGAGFEVELTREPGGTPLAEEIREIMLREREEQVAELAELLLVFAARAQHVRGKIEPNLAAGRWVISDRFIDATYAYQGGGRNIDTTHIDALAKMVIDGCNPDLTLFLDAPVEIALGRINDQSKDRIEQEQAAFFERVRAVYAARAARHEHIVKINAARPLADVQAEIRTALAVLLEKAKKST